MIIRLDEIDDEPFSWDCSEVFSAASLDCPDLDDLSEISWRGQVEKTPPTGVYADPPGAGLPIVRNGNDLIAVGLLDGSASLEQASNLSRDMRRWSPFEVGSRQTAPPP